MTTTINNTQDIIDSRDVIARIEELEGEVEALNDHVEACEAAYEFHDGDDTKSTPEYTDLLKARNELKDWQEENQEELDALKALAEQCEGYADWGHGEQVISAAYFVEYITDLINDCYEMPKEMNSGKWPFRHMKMDYEAAAEEAKVDYAEVDFDGNTYYIRSV